MTVMDKVQSAARATVQGMIDREPVNYLEGGAIYGIISQGRHNLSSLEIMYNHAQDSELKERILEAMEKLTRPLIEECEGLLKECNAEVPQFHFTNHQLQKGNLNIPEDARMTDMEIAAAVGTMAKAAQINILAALQSSYQLHIGMMFRRFLDESLDWNYRILQLMINRGWLPHVAKIKH
ncbi:MAG: DUF3231 family protein [Desulfitobacterium sp.]